jgi:hypothetical protein
MKLLFTRLQEEITTVRKSVTQFKVETGSVGIKAAELPAIELTPGPQTVEHRETLKPLKASLDDQKHPLALNANAEGIRDVVDIQGISKRDALSPVTYSANRALKTNPYPERLGDDSFLNSDNDYNQKNVSVYQKSGGSKDFSALDERRARFQYTTRKFISTQEMIEYHIAKEKRVSFELIV